MRRANGAAALEHVKIPRLGWSFHAAALITVASAAAARAQEVRPDTTTRRDTTTRADTTTRSDSTTHTVKRGDTLWDLAHTYLGDAYLWPEIYRLNTDLIEDPHWIFPGDVLKLPGRVAPEMVAAGVTPATPSRPSEEVFNPRAQQAPDEGPRRVPPGPTMFRAVQRNARTRDLLPPVPPPRVPFGDVLRAPYFDRENGPTGTGRLLVGADIPGVAIPAQTSNFQLYDKVLITPPDGSIAAERERFLAYELGPYVEDVGSVVIPIAVLRIVRAPRNGEAAVAEVTDLYASLNANSDTRIIPLDTAGAGATAKPVAVTADAGRAATIRAIHRPAVLPSLDYYVLFDLKTIDGMRIGDEIEIFRPRVDRVGDDGPAAPEVLIGRGQVVRVTSYGATARVTAQEQPAIREGQSVRVVARMP